VSLDGLEIPEHRYLSLRGLIGRGVSPGGAVHDDDWVHRCAVVPVLTIALCGGAIGLAKQALEDYPALIKGKTIAYTADAQEQNHGTHIRLADAASRIYEGERTLYAVADRLDTVGRAGEEIPFLEKARMRLDCATAVRRCLEGVDTLFKESGASGVRTSSPLCRALADLQAMNNHGLLKLETNQEMYGRLLLGLEPNTPLI
jgi:3-hydroxy-9,10-secoandrosta-1,3,5(10)-triene-9,17-dione monooxygenase